jgi:hypothetical protein
MSVNFIKPNFKFSFSGLPVAASAAFINANAAANPSVVLMSLLSALIFFEKGLTEFLCGITLITLLLISAETNTLKRVFENKCLVSVILLCAFTS